jgi:rhodanese-related sulfurtransferase
VLVCSDGVQSLKSAESLSKDGYINVFIVKGGLKGLMEEYRE